MSEGCQIRSRPRHGPLLQALGVGGIAALPSSTSRANRRPRSTRGSRRSEARSVPIARVGERPSFTATGVSLQRPDTHSPWPSALDVNTLEWVGSSARGRPGGQSVRVRRPGSRRGECPIDPGCSTRRCSTSALSGPPVPGSAASVVWWSWVQTRTTSCRVCRVARIAPVHRGSCVVPEPGHPRCGTSPSPEARSIGQSPGCRRNRPRASS